MRAVSGGGVLASTAVHVLDLLLWVIEYPDPLAVSATMLRRFPERRGNTAPTPEARAAYDVEDLVAAHIRCLAEPALGVASERGSPRDVAGTPALTLVAATCILEAATGLPVGAVDPITQRRMGLPSSLEFGLLHEFPRRPGQGEAAAFAEAFELVDAAERWGMDVVWVVELHQSTRSVLSSPLAVAAAIAGRTRRIRIGPAVQVLPLGNPLRLAEEWATVDQISQGRLIFGVGRASSPRSYLAYGIPYAESRARFAEALAIIRRAWTEPTLSYDGAYYRYADAVVSPRPAQQPHPPIRVAATSPETFVALGAQGYPILAAGRLGDRAELKRDLDHYRAAYRAAGHPGAGEVYVRLPIYVAETMAEAVADPEESILQADRDQETHRAQVAALGVAPRGDRGAGRGVGRGDVTDEQALREKILVGTPDVVAERLRELRDDLGLAGILAELNHGRLIPRERVLRSLRLLCAEVMPRFRPGG